MPSAYPGSTGLHLQPPRPANPLEEDGYDADDNDDIGASMDVDADADDIAQAQGQDPAGNTKGQKNFVNKLWV